MSKIETTCCIAGGGPAGIMAGYLLARAGVDTTVIEKHGDFFRDFRGDTVHPSTLEIMQELKILPEFLKLPHQEVRQVGAQIGDDLITIADFGLTGATSQFIAFMPQWDFLDFLVGQAKRYKNFKLMMQTEALGLIEENGRVVGIRTRSKKGEGEIRAKLVIGADGRSSVIRESAGLKVEDIGAPMDVLWMRMTRKETDPPQTLGRVKAGAIFIMLNRNDYWQCGYVIKKGGLDDLREAGMETFRSRILELAPFLEDRVGELKSWDDIRLLTVKVDRLRRWYRKGLLCIGDAAHAMSPIGGVGINLAIQDAVAAANLLWQSLVEDTITDEDLAKVQKRRSYPTRMTQNLQVFLQNHAVNPTLNSKQSVSAGPLKLFNAMPLLRGLPANLIGIGFRAEHVHSPDLGEKI